MAVLLASHCVGYHGLETSTQLCVAVLVHCICVDTSLLPLLSLTVWILPSSLSFPSLRRYFPPPSPLPLCVDTSLLPLLSLSVRLTLMSQQVRTGSPSSQEWTQSLMRVSTARALTTKRPCAVLCCAVLCCGVLCCGVLWCAVLCCAVVCCAVLCCAVLCCGVHYTCTYVHVYTHYTCTTCWYIRIWPSPSSEKRTYNGLPDFMTQVARQELENLSEDIPECNVIYLPQVGGRGREGG